MGTKVFKMHGISNRKEPKGQRVPKPWHLSKASVRRNAPVKREPEKAPQLIFKQAPALRTVEPAKPKPIKAQLLIPQYEIVMDASEVQLKAILADFEANLCN